MTCKAELCEFWTGFGCMCAVMGEVLDIAEPDPKPCDHVSGICDLCIDDPEDW